MSHQTSYLRAHEPMPGKRLRRRHRAFEVALAAVLAVGVCWVASLGVAAWWVGSSVLRAKDALASARDAAVALNFDSASAYIAAADARFVSAEHGMFVLDTLRIVPWAGDQVRAASATLSAGERATHAVGRLVSIGADLIRLSGVGDESLKGLTQGTSAHVTFDDLPAATKRAVLARLSAAAPDLETAAAELSIARSDLATIPTDDVVGPILAVLRPISDRLADAEELLQTLSTAAHILPAFAGLEEQRNTLILFLNNAELRPGGGFIGSYGLLGMKDGDISLLSTYDSYQLDNAAAPALTQPAPAPYQKYNAASKWFFRDDNWSPDFAESARLSVNLWQQELALVPADKREGIPTPTHLDGVIGITPTFVSSLMQILGPVKVGNVTFTAANIPDEIEYQVEAGYVGKGIPLTQRKAILADMLDQIKKRLYALPLSSWTQILQSTKTALHEKQFMLYSMDGATQDVLAEAGWGGVIAPETGSDVQMVVDASMGSLKSDPSVERSVQYDIFQNTAKQYIGRTTIHYAHHGSFDWKTTRYRTYVRAYVPAGSTFVRVTGSLLNDKLHNPSGAPGPVDVASELGLTSFGTFTSIEPGETRDVVFEYILAPSIVDAIQNGTYRMNVFKQPGAFARALTLNLQFDKKVANAAPSEASADWGDGTYHLQTTLEEDREFSVQF